jgi:hypothetical protein
VLSKLAIYAIIAVALLGALYWAEHSIYAAGVKSGSESVQMAWDQDKEAIAKVSAAALAEAVKEKEDALEANSVINQQYQTQLAVDAAANSALSERLRNAAARLAASSSAMQQTHSGSGPTAPSAPPGVGPVYDALAAVLTECADNRTQLDKLIAEIQPQL